MFKTHLGKYHNAAANNNFFRACMSMTCSPELCDLVGSAQSHIREVSHIMEEASMPSTFYELEL